MEDYTKVKKIIKLIVILVILIVAIAIGVIFYQNSQKTNSKNNLDDYLTAQNYTKDENGVSYIKKLNDNKNTTYRALYGDYVLFKEYTGENDEGTYTIGIGYTKDKTVEITFRLEGYNNNEISTIYQKGTYKNNKFECEIITNNGFDTQCKLMQQEAKEFEKEANEIIEKNKINPKYINIEIPEYLK